jgi:tRNA(Ile)-lysidine synthase
MVLEKVKRTISERTLIEKGEHIVVGVSGGPDSVCLLHVLHRLSFELDLDLHAVHINHCLRGEAADLDQAYTQALCENLGIPCSIFTYDVKGLAALKGLTTEEMGRKVRYEAFGQVRDTLLTAGREQGSSPSVKIAVAQNLNDQAETILMRILRGTGTDGLAAMEYIRDGKIIRPLLDITREEIEAYCKKEELAPRTDLTNLMPLYTRNKIRLELIPFLRDNYNEAILPALSRLVQIASEDKEFIYSHVDAALQAVTCEDMNQKVIRKAFCELHPAISKRVIIQIFKGMGLKQDISAVHLARGDKMIRDGKTGDQMEFPKGYGLRVGYDIAEFFIRESDGRSAKFNQESAKDICYQIKMNATIEVPALNGVLKTRILEEISIEQLTHGNPFIVYLRYTEQIREGNLQIRTRRPGDYIVPFGMTGTKKIQDYFVDEKIKREDRDRVPTRMHWFGSIMGHRLANQ